MCDELQQLREAIEQPLRECSDLDGAVLTGWMIIGEWSDTDGERWITSSAGDINDDSPPIWTVKGWLHHTLDGADTDRSDTADDD